MIPLFTQVQTNEVPGGSYVENPDEIQLDIWSGHLTLTLTSSNYYMSPLSLSACFAFCAISCILYLTLPRVRDLFLHWKSRLCGHWAGGWQGRGTEQNGFLCLATGTPRHWSRRSQDPKARYHWLWEVGAGVAGTVGGRDGDWE
jgi:hypothetical protein